MAEARDVFNPDEENAAYTAATQAQIESLAEHKVRLAREASAQRARLDALKPQMAEARLAGRKLPEWDAAIGSLPTSRLRSNRCRFRKPSCGSRGGKPSRRMGIPASAA